ncbi:hypothetical protein [Mariniluteicoccus flavus]
MAARGEAGGFGVAGVEGAGAVAGVATGVVAAGVPGRSICPGVLAGEAEAGAAGVAGVRAAFARFATVNHRAMTSATSVANTAARRSQYVAAFSGPTGCSKPLMA